MKILHDDFGNTATIEETFMFPYKGAKYKENAYILKLTADYENNALYFLSVYDSVKAALEKLQGISCGTFKGGN